MRLSLTTLQAKFTRFSEVIRQKFEWGLKGHVPVDEVLWKWVSIVNRVANKEVGEKMVVCGKAIT